MNIEKALRNYLKCNGPKVKEKDFFEYATGDGDAVLGVLFKLATEEVESIDEKKALDRVVEVLKLGIIVLRNNDGIDRKAIARKIVRLQTKMDRIVSEGQKKFSNIKKIQSEFNKVSRQLDALFEINEEKDTQQYDLMAFLIDETRNIDYLEFTLKKMPSLANVKDKDETPLFRNLIKRYLRCVMESQEEDALYFENLISLILSQNSFVLSEHEKRICLEEIYKIVNHMTYDKKRAKRNKEKVEAVNHLVERIKGKSEKKQDIETLGKRFNVHVSFQPSLLEPISLIKEPKVGQMTGRQLVEDYTISIDKPEAVELDDAISCKKLPNGNYLLGVHTASVLGYFPYESDIVQEAIYRRQSIYLPRRYQMKEDDFNRVIPIFPYAFSADKGSLKEGEKRLTRSYFFELTPEGEIVREEFPKTITVNRKRLTYKQVDELLEKESDGSPLMETIKNLSEVTNILRGRYKGSELYYKFKENMEDYSELRVKNMGSESMVFYPMLLTGNRVGEYFYQHGFPAMYRVHYVDEEVTKKLQIMIDNLNSIYGGEQFKHLYQLIEGIYPKGWYDLEGRHSGLDLDHYCHCTSLLRRSPDIVMEHALEVCYDKIPTKKELEELQADIEEKVKLVNSREPQIDYFIKEYQKRYRR